MKYTLAILALALTACNTTTESASQAEVQPKDGNVASQNMPIYENGGLFPKSADWKDKHFFNANKQYGFIAYEFYAAVAQVGSAECGIPLDYHYLSQAKAMKGRGQLQNVEKKKAKLKQVIADFERENGKFDAKNRQAVCKTMQKHIEDKTLLGAMFYVP